jgi:hypothetical protein
MSQFSLKSFRREVLADLGRMAFQDDLDKVNRSATGHVHRLRLECLARILGSAHLLAALEDKPIAMNDSGLNGLRMLSATHNSLTTWLEGSEKSHSEIDGKGGIAKTRVAKRYQARLAEVLTNTAEQWIAVGVSTVNP